MSMHTITIKDGGVKYNTTISKKGLAQLGAMLMNGLLLTEEEILNQDIKEDFELEIKFEVKESGVIFENDLRKEHWPIFVYCLFAPLMNEESEEVQDE